jgi:F-type H+-transporting ATPase subunit alpha
VPAFLADLVSAAHARHQELRAKIAGGDWSDDTQAAVKQAVGEFAEDFGYDLDEEGQALEQDAVAAPTAIEPQAAEAPDDVEPEPEDLAA